MWSQNSFNREMLAGNRQADVNSESLGTGGQWARLPDPLAWNKALIFPDISDRERQKGRNVDGDKGSDSPRSHKATKRAQIRDWESRIHSTSTQMISVTQASLLVPREGSLHLLGNKTAGLKFKLFSSNQ